MSDINATRGVKSGSEASTDPSTPKTWPKSYYENPKNRDGPLRHDIETYSPEDLTECGVYVYSAHPDFDILLCAFAYGDGPVEVLDLASGQPFPPWLEDDLKNPAVTKSAYNAMFERTCWSAYFHTYISPEGWVCTMIQAASVSYPFSLEKCGEALGTDVQKDKRGKDLIKLFSVPHKRRKKHPDGTITEEFYRVYPQDAPEDWEVFKEYNRVDVETERSIANMLKDYPLEGHELELYHLDQRINDRGILVDRVLVEEAIHCDEVYSQELRDKAIKLTGINNPNSPLQFRAWLEGRGCMIDSMGKKQVAEVMDKMAEQVRAGQGDPVVLEAIRIRQQISKSSIKKYMAAERFMCQDDRFRGGFQFYGANHTGRWCLAEGTPVLVKTPSGEVTEKPIEDVALDDLVFDGDNWVQHEGVVFSGDKEVITWDGITATEDHYVFIDDHTKVSLKEAMERGLHLWRGNGTERSTLSTE